MDEAGQAGRGGAAPQEGDGPHGSQQGVGRRHRQGKALKKEADELLSFANDVQNMPETQQAMAEAHKLLNELNTKYSSVAAKGQGLADEGLKLWSSVSSSKEADALVVQGKNLLADWTKYAQSDQGKDLLNKAQSKVQGQSGGLVSMIDDHVLDKGTTHFTAAHRTAGEQRCEMHCRLHLTRAFPTFPLCGSC